MITILRRLHLYYYFMLTALVFYLFYPLFYYTTRKPQRFKTLNRLRKINAILPLWLSGIFFRVKWEKELRKDAVYIYCPNHTSFLDIPILLALGNGKHHFMGKEELKENPVLKIFFETIDITVKRESKIGAYRAFKKAAANIKAGMSLIIFPEGGILNKYPPHLHHFKNGAFRLAIEQQVPIIPVTIANAWEILFDDGALLGSCPGFIDIFVHQPIETVGMAPDDDEQLKKQVHHLIYSKLLEYEDRQKRSGKDSTLSPARR